MPNDQFLEEYPLYRKFELELPEFIYELPKVNINMFCEKCQSTRTFTMINDYTNLFPSYYLPSSVSEEYTKYTKILYLIYLCASCRKFNRYFLVKIDDDLKYIRKVGQYPSWGIGIGKKLKKILGKYAEYYKRGKICESQSYGIAAYAYYRRIIEELIDELLDSILDLMSGGEKEQYEEALEQTKQTKITKEKIDLVKDLIPPILMPEQFNPLKTLHEILSEGIHDKSDEECLEVAEIIRNILEFLVNSLVRRKKEQQTYTEGMKKLLEKKRKHIEKVKKS